MTVINSRTRGPAPMMMGNLNDEASNHDTSSDELVEGEDGELNGFGSQKRQASFHQTPARSKTTPKMEGKAEPTKNVFAVSALAELTAEQRLT